MWFELKFFKQKILYKYSFECLNNFHYYKKLNKNFHTIVKNNPKTIVWLIFNTYFSLVFTKVLRNSIHLRKKFWNIIQILFRLLNNLLEVLSFAILNVILCSKKSKIQNQMWFTFGTENRYRGITELIFSLL